MPLHQTSDPPRGEFEPTHNLSTDFLVLSCAVFTITTPWPKSAVIMPNMALSPKRPKNVLVFFSKVAFQLLPENKIFENFQRYVTLFLEDFLVKWSLVFDKLYTREIMLT